MVNRAIHLGTSWGSGVPATTWDPSNKTTNLTLSNSNRTVTFNAGSNQVAGLKSIATVSAPVYIEHVIGTVGSDFAFGFGTSSASNTDGNAGRATVSTAFTVHTNNGTFACDDSAQGFMAVIPSTTNGDRIGIAFHPTSRLAYFRKNGGGWNATLGGAQDPVALTGGCATFPNGTFFAYAVTDGLPSDVFTTNFASSSWVDPAPSGYGQLA